MKILFALPEYHPQTGGGITTNFSALLPWLARAGHDVRVVYGSSSLNSPGGGTFTIEGIKTEILDSTLFKKFMPRFARYAAAPKLQRHLAAAWALWEQAQRGPAPDIVQATDWGLLFLPWMMRQGPPVVASLHGSIGQIAHHDPLEGDQTADAVIQMVEAIGLAAIDAVITHSKTNAHYWTQKLARDIGLLRPIFTPRTTTRPRNIRSDRGLAMGRVQKWKGPHLLCEATRLLGQAAPDVDWVGRDLPIHTANGSTSRHLAQTWPDIWGSRIRHLPQEKPAEIHERQHTAGFVVVPSTWDVFNFTCVESMAAAAPVICSSGAGASDLIEHGVSGLVFDPTSGQSLAEPISQLLGMSAQRRRELGEAGAETISTALTPEAVLPARLDFYDTLRRGAHNTLRDSNALWGICSPSDAPASLDDSLSQIALRPLLSHSLRRVVRKFTSGQA